MTAEQFNDWLAAMRVAGIAKTDKHCGELLGKSQDRITIYKRQGTDHATALACSALLSGIKAYEGAQ